MRPSAWIVALRVLALAALAASAALLVDYTTAEPTFCGAGSGCAEVRRSGFGYLVLGSTVALPVPLFGLLGFAALFAASLLGRPERRRRAVLVLGSIGGLAALVLFALQAFVVHRFCSLCVFVDACGLLGAAVAHAEFRRPALTPVPFDLRLWAWICLAVLAIAAPIAWARLRPPPPVPAGVQALYIPGKINVVEFADFECPYCRDLHARLKSLLAPYRANLHFVRLNFPLESHPFARGAARSAVCARQQAKGEEIAEALFSADDLSLAANRQLAVRLGLDMPRYDACLNDKLTDRTIDQESQILKDAGFLGLPTTFIGPRQIIGAQPDDVFRDALSRGTEGQPGSGLGAARFVLVVTTLALAILALGRSPKLA